MRHELKIIILCETEDFEHDGDPPTVHDFRVSLDGDPIGVIQHVKIEADCKNLLPVLEFTFLDFENSQIDPSNSQFKTNVHNYVNESVSLLSQIRGIKIKKRKLFDGKIDDISLEKK